MAILSETSSVRRGDRVTIIYKLLDDESVDETASTAVDALDFERATLLVETGAGVNAGVVTLDGARTAAYAGTWAELGETAALAAASTTYLKTVDASVLPVPFIRARISTAIGVGTIDAYLILQR